MVNSSSVVLNWLATFISNFCDIIFMIRKFKILLMYHMEDFIALFILFSYWKRQMALLLQLHCSPIEKDKCLMAYLMLCEMWYHLSNLKNVKNTHGRVLLLVKLQASTFNFTKSNTPSWIFLRFFKLLVSCIFSRNLYLCWMSIVVI